MAIAAWLFTLSLCYGDWVSYSHVQCTRIDAAPYVEPVDSS